MKGSKNDAAARGLFGKSYDHIPKSTFAAVCYFFAQRCADDFGEDGDAVMRTMISEIETLRLNRIVSDAQARAATKALSAEL